MFAAELAACLSLQHGIAGRGRCRGAPHADGRFLWQKPVRLQAAVRAQVRVPGKVLARRAATAAGGRRCSPFLEGNFRRAKGRAPGARLHSFLTQTGGGYDGTLENRRWVVGPRGDRCLTRTRPARLGCSPRPRPRRNPGSTAARPGAARTMGPSGARGPRGDRSLSAADAAFVRGTEPAAIFIHADVPQGHGGSLENRCWVVRLRGNLWLPRTRPARLGCSPRPRPRGNPLGEGARNTVGMQPSRKREGKPGEGGGAAGRSADDGAVWSAGPRGNRSLSAADAAFVRGTEPAAIFIHADVPQGHGGSLENRLWVVGPRGDRCLTRTMPARLGCSPRPRPRGNPGSTAARPGAARTMWPPGARGRGGTAHSRRLTPPSFAAQNPPRFSSMLMSRRVMGAPSKIAERLLGRGGTAGFRARGQHGWDAALGQGRGETRGARRRGRALRGRWGRLERGAAREPLTLGG
jgi:hypothetical protein